MLHLVQRRERNSQTRSKFLGVNGSWYAANLQPGLHAFPEKTNRECGGRSRAQPNNIAVVYELQAGTRCRFLLFLVGHAARRSSRPLLYRVLEQHTNTLEARPFWLVRQIRHNSQRLRATTIENSAKLRVSFFVFPVLGLWKFQARDSSRVSPHCENPLSEQPILVFFRLRKRREINSAEFQSCTKLLGLTALLIARRFVSPSATIQLTGQILRQSTQLPKSSLPQRVTKREESRQRVASLSHAISDPSQATHRSTRIPGCARA